MGGTLDGGLNFLGQLFFGLRQCGGCSCSLMELFCALMTCGALVRIHDLLRTIIHLCIAALRWAVANQVKHIYRV